MNALLDKPPDLDLLRKFLSSDAAPEGALSLSSLDGYLTAVAIGPELLMPSEWLARIWDEGGDPEAGPAFEGKAEVEAILGAIMARYNEILRLIAEAPESYAPILERSPEVVRDGLEWAGGFLRGMSLRAGAWGELLGSEEDRVAIEPILALLNTPEGNPFFDVPAEEVDAFHADALKIAPAAVLGIALYWRELGLGPSAPPPRPRVRSEKIGRNAPCPCGSGRKHKKCCGA